MIGCPIWVRTARSAGGTDREVGGEAPADAHLQEIDIILQAQSAGGTTRLASGPGQPRQFGLTVSRSILRFPALLGRSAT